MINLKELNVANFTQLMIVNDSIINKMTLENKMSNLMQMNNQSYNELNNVYLIENVEKLNEEMINNINDEYKVAKLIYNNLENIEKKHYLNERFWTYLNIEIFHKYTYTLMVNNQLNSEYYKKNIICSSVQYKDIFANAIASKWYTVYICKKLNDSDGVLKFIYDNKYIIDKLFNSELFLTESYLLKVLQCLYQEEINEKLIDKVYEESMNKIYISVLDLYTIEDVKKIIKSVKE